MNSSIILPPPKLALIAEECCGRCRHVMVDYGTGAPEFFCRRFPPVPFPVIVVTPDGPRQAGAVSNWPVVREDQVCGEFKRKIHRGHASAS